MVWTIHAAVLEDTSLSSTERLVLLAVVFHLNSWGEGAFPSIKRLSSLTGYSTRTVQRTLHALAKAAYIEIVTRLRPNGSQSTNEYRVNPMALVRKGAENPTALDSKGGDTVTPTGATLRHGGGDTVAPLLKIHSNKTLSTVKSENKEENPLTVSTTADLVNALQTAFEDGETATELWRVASGKFVKAVPLFWTQKIEGDVLLKTVWYEVLHEGLVAGWNVRNALKMLEIYKERVEGNAKQRRADKQDGRLFTYTEACDYFGRNYGGNAKMNDYFEQAPIKRDGKALWMLKGAGLIKTTGGK